MKPPPPAVTQISFNRTAPVNLETSAFVLSILARTGSLPNSQDPWNFTFRTNGVVDGTQIESTVYIQTRVLSEANTWVDWWAREIPPPSTAFQPVEGAPTWLAYNSAQIEAPGDPLPIDAAIHGAVFEILADLLFHDEVYGDLHRVTARSHVQVPWC